MYITRASGTAARTLRLDRRRWPRAELGDRSGAGRTRPWPPTSSSSGPRCSVRRWMSAAHRGERPHGLGDPALHLGRGRLADQQALHLHARTMAMATSRTPMAMLPTASQRGFAGDGGQHRRRRGRRPGRSARRCPRAARPAARVACVRWMKLPPADCVALVRRGTLAPRCAARALEHDRRRARMTMATPRFSVSCGWRSLSMPS